MVAPRVRRGYKRHGDARDVRCERCGVAFRVRAYRFAASNVRFCSRECYRVGASPTPKPGDRFGRLVVQAVRFKDHKVADVRCDCGTTKTVTVSHLLRYTRSCGCWNNDVRRTNKLTHGHSRENTSTPTYKTWQSMLMRCGNAKYKNYRDVRVCDRWRSFENFLADMGERPSLEYSIDRINPHGHYEPGNCRWATRIVQARNRRDAVMLSVFGETKCLGDWADDSRCKVPRGLFRQRIRKGWDAARAMTEARHPDGSRHSPRRQTSDRSRVNRRTRGKE